MNTIYKKLGSITVYVILAVLIFATGEAPILTGKNDEESETRLLIIVGKITAIALPIVILVVVLIIMNLGGFKFGTI